MKMKKPEVPKKTEQFNIRLADDLKHNATAIGLKFGLGLGPLINFLLEKLCVAEDESDAGIDWPPNFTVKISAHPKVEDEPATLPMETAGQDAVLERLATLIAEKINVVEGKDSQ